MKRKLLSLVSAVLFTFWGATLGFATTISYTATDLADGSDGDLWQYSYILSGAIFNENSGFTIYFDYNLYSHLAIQNPTNSAEWDTITLDPDPNLPDAGVYDALALKDDASLADPFTVSFVWLGGSGGPGSQYFEIYIDEPSNSFEILDDGFTTSSAVPEPGTMLLFGTGLAALIGSRRGKRSSER